MGRRLRGRLLAAGLALGAVPVTVAWQTAQAQAGQPVERIVEGQVISSTGQPLSGAVVYLQNGKNNAIKSYLTDGQGHFHFGNLSQNTDYSIWAESNGERSHTKNISSFDSKNSFNFTLKIDHSNK